MALPPLRRNRFARRALTLAVAVCLGWSAPLGAEQEASIETLRTRLLAAPDDAETRQALGDALFREGEALESLQIQNPDRTPDEEWVPELRNAAELYLEVGNLEAARRALKDAIEIAPGDASLYEDLAALLQAEPREAKPGVEPDQVATARADADETDASPAEAARPTPRRASPRAEATDWLGNGLLAVGILALLGLTSLLVRVMRGKGDLAVAIECPADMRGSFSVRLARKRERARPDEASTAAENRASTPFEHNLIARETHFRGIPARSYWLTIDGTLTGSDRSERVRRDREVRVEKGRTVPVSFDLRPEACVVELEIVSNGQPVPEARVALGGDPTSLRFAKSGVAKLNLPLGQHSILVGTGDRAAERTLDIESLVPMRVEIDVDDDLAQVFCGCEAAIEPFLRGDLSVAAAALERAGQSERASLLLGRFHQHRGSAESAAERFEAAGRLLEAAELWAEHGAYERAAMLFERGNDHARAAEMYNFSGDLIRAGRAYEEADDYEAAIVCYREADAPRLLDVLEKQGESFEAGQLALARGENSRAIRSFQQVDARDPNYFEACRTLATAFQQQGKLELAVQKADEAITFSRPDETSPDTYFWYGELLSTSGRPERALQVFQDLAERSPEHPGVTTRIEELRKNISRAKGDSAATEVVGHAFDESSRYEIVREVGSGGMGIVYQARDRRLGREVALKRLPDSLKDHPRAVDLFMREARASAALNHPNIVTVHDVDQEGGLFFITMELLTGETLSEVVRRHGKLQALDIVKLGIQTASGLGYAHSQGIIHRDIKSANLFLTSDRVVKIMDFGLAKMTEEVRRATTVVGGTPYYMAPEQATGENVDHRADLYAFGVTLFELATARRPFEEGDVTWHHKHTAAPDPRSMGAEIPEALAELILQLMSKEADDRPSQAEQVARRLQQIGQAAQRMAGSRPATSD